MIDPKLLRTQIEDVAKLLATRQYTLDIATYNALEEKRRELQVKTQELQNQRNTKSKLIGQAKAKGEDTQSLMQEVSALAEQLTQVEYEFKKVQAELKTWQMGIPNLPHASVPVGKDEKDNQEIRRWGESKQFNFDVLDHADLGAQLSMMDFEASAKLTGSRFVVLHKDLARLHRALIQFMLDLHINEHGYQEVYVPYIVNSDSLYGTSQLPKFADDQFALKGENDYYLIPTAEVPVTNLSRGEILDSVKLPIKYVCHTPCFRSEAGTYGKDTKGMLRQHQFEKVELVQFVKPENSYQALEELTGHAEKVLQMLQLPYRVMALCTGDIGFSAAKTYDLEVWLPSQNCYREISSCSNTEDFQARRIHARWRNPETGKPELIHTLNGSGLAVGRTLIAIMENYQDAQGRIHIPEALWSYMGGLQIIGDK